MGRGIFKSIFISGSPTPIGAPEPAPDILHSTLLSLDAIENPIVGPTGTLTGGPTFDADGVEIDENSEYIQYPLSYNRQGTMEFTIRPLHDDTYGTVACYVDNPTNVDKILFRYIPGTPEFQFFFGGVGGISINTTFPFNINTKLTFRGLWDENGINAGPNKLEFYINNILQGVNTSALPTTNNTIIRIGNAWFDGCHINAKMKDIKIWSTVLVP